ncbi:MAG: hypothetical protein U5O15_09235 [Candidatus Krumholzibacteriota bacterium]|nr:hypothetical protein [Candidatus Krumholzibacteriota bacterium]
MIHKSALLMIAIIIILPASALAADSIMEQIEFNANAGLSMPIGDTGDSYNTGICFGLDGFIPHTDNILLGGRIAYNRWGVDEGGWTGTDIDGSASIMEFIPQVKYLFSQSDSTGSTNKYFGQAGIGFYRSAFDVDVGNDNYDDSEINLGMSLGGGIIIHQSESRRWEIKPALNIIFNDGTSKYFTISGGFSF